MAYHGGNGVAVHEAAHAVVAHLLGLPVEKLTIVPCADWAGACFVGDPLPASATPTRAQSASAAQRRLVATLAARAAVGHQYPEPTRYSRDTEQAWHLARQVVGDDDPSRAFEVAAVVKDAHERAAGLVEGFAFAIADVARQLVFHGTLEGAAAREVVAAAIERQLTTSWDTARASAQRALAVYGQKRRRKS
jgi:hypothetical protein